MGKLFSSKRSNSRLHFHIMNNKLLKCKRSQVNIITLILIVLIVLVAVLIVWSFVKPIVQTSSEGISAEQIAISLRIDSVYIPDDNESIIIGIKRGLGGGNISALKFIFEDEDGEEYYYSTAGNYSQEQMPEPLETRVYWIKSSDIEDLDSFANIISVAVAFVYRTKSGKEITSIVQDIFRRQNKDLRKDKDLADKINTERKDEVSWISFVPPTPSDGHSTSNTNTEINVSIGADLEEVKFNWDGINYLIYDDTLKLFMNFDKVSVLGENDTYIVDLSGNGNNGNISGANWISNGKYRGAISVQDGGHVEAESNGIDASEGTILIWVRPDTSTVNSGYIVAHTFGTNNRIYLYQSWSNFYIRLGGGSDIDTGRDFSVGEWSYIGLTWNSSKNYAAYFNGDLIDSGSFTDLTSVDGLIYLGSIKDFSWSFWDGSFDELMIFNRKLSDGEIKQLYFSNLYKYDVDKWGLYVNQSLDIGPHTYFAYAKNSSGNEKNTETRSITRLLSCGIFSTPNTIYVLEQDLVKLSGTCFDIQADNVTIDLNGYTVIGNVSGGNCLYEDRDICDYGDVQQNYAVYSQGYNGIAIKNGHVRNFSNGIYLKNSDNSVIYNMQFKYNSASGINLDAVSNINLTNIISHNNSWHGFQGWNVVNSVFDNFTGYSNLEEGFSIRKDSNYNTLLNFELWDCSAGYASSFFGCLRFIDSSNNLIQNININGSGGNAVIIYADDPATLGTGSNCSNNVFKDILIKNTVNEGVIIGSDAGSGTGVGAHLNNSFINVSYSEEYVNMNSELIRKWYYRAKVQDSGGAGIQGAKVNATSSQTPNGDFVLMTDALGYTNVYEIIDYVNSTGGVIDYSNYDIETSKLGYTSSSDSYEVVGNELEHLFVLL